METSATRLYHGTVESCPQSDVNAKNSQDDERYTQHAFEEAEMSDKASEKEDSYFLSRPWLYLKCLDDLQEHTVPDETVEDGTNLNDTITPCCLICRNLDPTAKGPKLWWDKRPGSLFDPRAYWLFKDSSIRGCNFCTLICRILLDFLRWDLDRSSELALKAHEGYYIELGLVSRSSLKMMDLRLYVPEGWPPAWEGLAQAKLLSYNARPDQYFDFARTSLGICTETHGLCNRGVSLLPKRVIDVGKNGCTIRLVEPEPSDIHTRYVALSHCWGKTRHITTTNDSLERRKEEIKFQDFPPTFQDAIRVTRKFGIRYLWIDSLCILQDNKEDWATQSAQMGRIYRDAFFTIAATSSSSSVEGFLKSSSSTSAVLPFGKNDITPEEKDTDASETTIEVRNWAANHLEQPLDKRAWTFQEYHLSTRLIQFCEGDIAFRCTTGETCECWPFDSGAPGRITYRALNTEDEQQVHQKWHQIVRDYSERAITYPSDRLPALSGLTALVYERTNWQYVAGLWKETLLSNLLWCTFPGEFRHDAPEVELAPSFSWASLEQPVNYEVGDLEPGGDIIDELCTAGDSAVVDCNSTTVSSNPFGQVADGYIILKGRLTSITINDIEPGHFRYVVKFPVNISGFLYADSVLGACELQDSEGTLLRSVRRAKAKDSEVLTSCPAFAFTVQNWKRSTGSLWLVLGRSPKEPAAFVRVGLYRAWEGQEADVERLWMEHSQEAVVKIV